MGCAGVPVSRELGVQTRCRAAHRNVGKVLQEAPSGGRPVHAVRGRWWHGRCARASGQRACSACTRGRTIVVQLNLLLPHALLAARATAATAH